MSKPLAYDRNGDTVYPETLLYGKDSTTPSNRIRQDEQHEDCVILTTLDGQIDNSFFHDNGFGQFPRLTKANFKNSYWQVKPYN